MYELFMYKIHKFIYENIYAHIHTYMYMHNIDVHTHTYVSN